MLLAHTTTSAQSRCCEASANRSASASVAKTPSKDSAKNSCADSMYDANLRTDSQFTDGTAVDTVPHVKHIHAVHDTLTTSVVPLGSSR